MGEKPLVLIVDDEPGILKILTIQLKHSGCDVVSTTEGAEAVGLVRSKNPDIVLLDVLMPDVSGLEVLDQVREFSNVPVIIFTANPKIVEIAAQIGANECIPKPCDPDWLTEKIKEIVSNNKN
jgi:DNA-binding response OmpR family regulator